MGADLARLERRDEDAIRSSCQQPRQIGLAHGERQASQIVTVQRHDVEGVELDLCVVFSGMQRVQPGGPNG